MEDTVTDDTSAPEQEAEQPAVPDTDWKSEARKWEKRAKDNADAAARLRELEDEQKSEQDKLTERLAELETSAKSSTLEAARLRVAIRKGLPESLVDRLRGDTLEDIEQDADELLVLIQSDDPSVEPSRRPRERLRPGAAPDADPAPSPDQLADEVIRRSRGY
jgi:flagellar motility protein MotE (MotC chaperone)